MQSARQTEVISVTKAASRAADHRVKHHPDHPAPGDLWGRLAKVAAALSWGELRRLVVAMERHVEQKANPTSTGPKLRLHAADPAADPEGGAA